MPATLQVFDGVYLWKRYESRKFLIPFWFNADTGQVRARRRRRRKRRRSRSRSRRQEQEQEQEERERERERNLLTIETLACTHKRACKQTRRQVSKHAHAYIHG